MGSKKSKQTKKFNKNHLAQTILDRRKHQAKKQQIAAQRQKKAAKKGAGGGTAGARGKAQELEDGDENDRLSDGDAGIDVGDQGGDMTVDDLLNAKGLDSAADDEEGYEEIEDDLHSIGSEDESALAMDLEKLKETDPDFYKYLEDNDRDLLEFDPEALGDSEGEASIAVASSVDRTKKPKKRTVVTKDLLKTWQRAILEKRSLRAMRKLLIAFRSAVFSASEDGSSPFVVESSSVFNALVKTTVKYTPVYLSQSLPAKELPNGRFKISTNSKLHTSAQRLIRSYFSSLLELVGQLPSQAAAPSSGKGKARNADAGDSLLYIAVSDSAKLTPWVVGNRKVAKVWSKALFELWATSDDRVRIAAYLALRRLALASDPSMQESILKGLYTNIIRSAKSTSAYTLPTINLMKNTAVEMFLAKQDASYPLIFSFIRQLAIHLRNSIKLKTKEGFQGVYNWQFLHGLDFWSLVLSAACEKDSIAKQGPSPLQPLIYPLVQITLGVITLIPTSRYYPLRFQCARLLLRLTQRTGTFIPIASYLLEALESPDLQRNPKPSAQLKPLDWEYYIRAPKPYQRTRTFADGVSEEAAFLLLEFYATHACSIAFPELALPVLMQLKRFAKRTKNPKASATVRALVDKLEAQGRWIEERRRKVDFSPADQSQVAAFLSEQDPAKTPLGAFHKAQLKAREQRRAALERTAVDEIVAD